jgi:hypothetical protein
LNEPFFVILLGLDYPLHGFFHSLLGGGLVAIALFLVMFKIDKVELCGRLSSHIP